MRKYILRLVLVAYVFLFFIAIIFTFCTGESTYPQLEYRNSSYNYDKLNKTISLKKGYILNDVVPYSMVETEIGYDVVIHFIKE